MAHGIYPYRWNDKNEKSIMSKKIIPISKSGFGPDMIIMSIL
jgi:hypothetical protein